MVSRKPQPCPAGGRKVTGQSRSDETLQRSVAKPDLPLPQPGGYQHRHRETRP